MRIVSVLVVAVVGFAVAVFTFKSKETPNPVEPESVEVKIDRVKHLKDFVGKYCTDCHDEDIQKGGVDLTAVNLDIAHAVDETILTKVYDQVASGSMPPKKKKKQPSQEERESLKIVLGDHLTEKISTRHEALGRTVIRRLTREEYENTLKDLFDLPDLEVKEFLPSDPKAHGFDNVAHNQTLSHVQIARYLDAADFVLDNAMNPQPKPQYLKLDKKASEVRRFQITNDKKTVGDKVYLTRQPNSAQTPWRLDGFNVPFTGKYRLKIWAYGTSLKKDEEVPIKEQHVLMFYGNPSKNVLRKKGNVDIPSNECNEPIEIELDLHSGETPLFQIATMSGKTYGPAIAIERIIMEGPIIDSWPLKGHKLLFGDLKSVEWKKDSLVNQPLKRHLNYANIRGQKKVSTNWMLVSENPEADAKRLLHNFMSKAFRRPVELSEVEPYLSLVQARLKDKYCFHDAMKSGYKAILCAPDFIYLKENFGELNDYALASRLSYFIWKSMPDQELMDLAAQGKLKDKAVLKQQTERMLADFKSKRFAHSFIDQWLELEDINLTFPDSKLYPEFNDWLLDSMARETYSFFEKMVQDNLSATHLVDSDFLMLNQRLAELYEIDGVRGDRIRPVNIPSDSVRGGLLTQASILKITANGTTTSPVIRGAWVTENIIGKHIPPPPPNAGSVEPDTRGATTIRELLDKHRDNESCKGCHKLIDPPGFALESFDVMGGYRTKYRNMVKGKPVKKKFLGIDTRYKLGLDVDATGQSLSGEEFTNINEFRDILLKDKKGLAKNLINKLMVFSTAAQVHYTDRKVVKKIIENSSKDDFGVRSIIHEIVQSQIFRRK